MTQAVPILVGYLFGSIPFALLVSRGLAGVDVRRVGSGNVGSANVLRTSGVATALLVMVLDMAKGAGSVLLADRWSAAASTPAVAGLAAIVGHVYPIWLRFRGGKGVATACGVFAVLTPWAVLPAFALFVATVWATRFVSLGSLVAALALGPIAYALAAPPASWLAAAGAAILIVFRHRSNVARLRAGTERRIGQRVPS
ncbi:MAG TPA: glycerol-3-phosphate 1-O-acyltransferase PlsY [Vicinamibacterales bacterium]|jgi:glycerol-3-phosphate acyltransferase PlsY|nr:glycerol-3-phosphate 1-O-acyltransferase PlsY [Vicinamibacterales bacterium]